MEGDCRPLVKIQGNSVVKEKRVSVQLVQCQGNLGRLLGDVGKGNDINLALAKEHKYFTSM